MLELCSLGGLFPAYRQKWFTTVIGLRILWGCARALSYMHSFPVPIVHRDLKSGNILVTAEKVGKIADCGESRRVDFESTMTQIGTPMWAAPEVLRGKRYDEYVFWFCLLSRVSTVTRPFVRLRKTMHWCSGKRNGNVSCCTVLTQNHLTRTGAWTRTLSASSCLRSTRGTFLSPTFRATKRSDSTTSSPRMLLQGASESRTTRPGDQRSMT